MKKSTEKLLEKFFNQSQEYSGKREDGKLNFIFHLLYDGEGVVAQLDTRHKILHLNQELFSSKTIEYQSNLKEKAQEKGYEIVEHEDELKTLRSCKV